MGSLDPSFKCALIEFPCLAPDSYILVHFPPLPAKIRCAENALKLNGKRNSRLLFNRCFYTCLISDVSRAPLVISAD